MITPTDIEDQLVEFMCKFSNTKPGSAKAVKRSELHYQGEHLVDGIVTHFWACPGLMWIYAQELEGKLHIDLSDEGPVKHPGIVVEYDRQAALEEFRKRMAAFEKKKLGSDPN